MNTLDEDTLNWIHTSYSVYISALLKGGNRGDVSDSPFKRFTIKELIYCAMVTVFTAFILIFVIILESRIPVSDTYSTTKDKFGDLYIHCGQNESSMVNITYFGDISSMYVDGRYKECSSTEVSPAYHAIYNINGRDCGFVEINNTNVWTVTVRLLKGFLVTSDDKLINLACSYDSYDTAEYNVSVKGDDSAIYVPSNKVNTENLLLSPYHIHDAVVDILANIFHKTPEVTITVLDTDDQPITTLYPHHIFHVRFAFHSMVARAYGAPVIKTCNVTGDATPLNFTRAFIRSGCLDYRFTKDRSKGVETAAKDGLDLSSASISQTIDITLPKSWSDVLHTIRFECDILLVKSHFKFKQTCPLNLRKYGDEAIKVVSRSKFIKIKRIWMRPPFLKNGTMMSDAKREKIATWNYLPYLVITTILVIFLIVFGIVLLCVLREQMIANRKKDMEMLEKLSFINRSQSIADWDKKDTLGVSRVDDSGFSSIMREPSCTRLTDAEVIHDVPHDVPRLQRALSHSTPRKVSFLQNDKALDLTLENRRQLPRRSLSYPRTQASAFSQKGEALDLTLENQRQLALDLTWENRRRRQLSRPDLSDPRTQASELTSLLNPEPPGHQASAAPLINISDVYPQGAVNAPVSMNNLDPRTPLGFEQLGLAPTQHDLLQSGPFQTKRNVDPLSSDVPMTKFDFGGVGISMDTHELARCPQDNTGRNIIPLLPPIRRQSTSVLDSINVADLSDPFPDYPNSRMEITGASNNSNTVLRDNSKDRNFQSFVLPNANIDKSFGKSYESTKL